MTRENDAQQASSNDSARAARLTRTQRLTYRNPRTGRDAPTNAARARLASAPRPAGVLRAPDERTRQVDVTRTYRTAEIDAGALDWSAMDRAAVRTVLNACQARGAALGRDGRLNTDSLTVPLSHPALHGILEDYEIENAARSADRGERTVTRRETHPRWYDPHDETPAAAQREQAERRHYPNDLARLTERDASGDRLAAWYLGEAFASWQRTPSSAKVTPQDQQEQSLDGEQHEPTAPTDQTAPPAQQEQGLDGEQHEPTDQTAPPPWTPWPKAPARQTLEEARMWRLWNLRRPARARTAPPEPATPAPPAPARPPRTDLELLLAMTTEPPTRPAPPARPPGLLARLAARMLAHLA